MINFQYVGTLSLALALAVLSACSGGSSGGTAATSAPAPTTTATTAAAQAPTTAEKALPAVDTAAAQGLLSADQTLQTVNFPPTGTTTVSGKIQGYKSAAYAVPAKAGQTLKVSMTKSGASGTSANFNVRDVRDQSGAAVHRGEVDGPQATISVPADTTYLIDPFLERAVARRGSTADYTLTISRQ